METRATPSSCNCAMGGVAAPARMFRGPSVAATQPPDQVCIGDTRYIDASGACRVAGVATCDSAVEHFARPYTARDQVDIDPRVDHKGNIQLVSDRAPGLNALHTQCRIQQVRVFGSGIINAVLDIRANWRQPRWPAARFRRRLLGSVHSHLPYPPIQERQPHQRSVLPQRTFPRGRSGARPQTRGKTRHRHWSWRWRGNRPVPKSMRCRRPSNSGGRGGPMRDEGPGRFPLSPFA